jgi:MGT family glycosyltransferase
MSTYLLTCTPAHGHVAPLLTVARHLVASGHRVRFLTSVRYGDRVRATGAEFLPLPRHADVDLDNPNAGFPERAKLRGVPAIRFDMLNLFLRPGRSQFAAVQAALAEAPVDAVLTEPMFIGSALLNELPRAQRPAVIALGILPLGAKSRDTAPFGLGVTPKAGAMGRLRNAALTTVAERMLFAPLTREANALSVELIGSPLSRFLLDWTSGADAVAQFTVPEFEYPRSDLPDTIHFIGPLPATAPEIEVPDWWDDLDGSRPIVHVTQGTIANTDTTQLLRPTIEALAADDVLVVATTGGRSTEEFDDLPANARVARYLPYDRLLPRVDVLVTNGGYGGVHQALAHGIPIIVAGQTEDKVEVSARVGWSGTGVNLKTNRPDAATVRAAVRRVLADTSYRDRARQVGAAIAQAPGLAGLDSVLESVRLGRLSGSSLSA